MQRHQWTFVLGTGVLVAMGCTGRTGDDNGSTSGGSTSSSSTTGGSSVAGSGGTSTVGSSGTGSSAGGSSGVVGSSSVGGASSGVVGSSSVGGASSGIVGSSSGVVGSSSGVVGSSSGVVGSSSGVVGSSGGGGSSGSVTPGPVLQAFQQQFLAGCATEDRCVAVASRLSTNNAACQAYAADLLDAYVAFFGDYFDTHYTLDSTAFQACLTSLANAPCDQVFRVGNPCANYIIPVNPVGNGQACDGAFAGPVLCNTGSVCRGPSSSCLTCQALLPDNAPCTNQDGYDGACAGNVCISGACSSVRPTVGQPCVADCYGNLECAGPFGSRTCQPRRALNESCGGNNSSCMIPLVCDDATNTCRQPIPTGQACSRAVQGNCSAFEVCRFATPNATMGTCGPTTPRPGNGEACLEYGQCGQGLWADNTVVGACTCRNKLADGQPCSVNAYGQCQNACLNGVCGVLFADGAACAQNSDCQSDNCALTAGGTQTVCQVAQCVAPTPPSCNPPPANTSKGTAAALPLGSATQVTFCGDSNSEYWLRIAGPFSVGTAVELVVTGFNSPGGSTGFTLVRDDHGFDETLSSCGYYGGVLRCAGFIDTDPANALFVKVFTYSSNTLAQNSLVLAQTVGDGVGACASPPTNTSQANAIQIMDNVAVNGTFCSRGSDTEYWWRLPGNFVAGDVFHLRPTSTDLQTDYLGLTVGTVESGNYLVSTYCSVSPYQTMPDRCFAQLSAPATEVFVVTDANPSIRRQNDFSFTLQKVPAPQPECANPPANRSQGAAIVLPEDTATNGRFCSSVLNEEYWWRVNTPITTTTTCRLQVNFANGASARDVDFELLFPNGTGQFYGFAYCYAGAGTNEDCMGTPFMDASEFYIATTSNPTYDVREEPFTLTVGCN